MTIIRLKNNVITISNNAERLKKAIISLAVVTAFAVSFLGNSFVSKASIKDLGKAKSCSFIVPSGFKPTETPGLYVNEHYPLESANILYSVTEIPQDRILTNDEVARGEKADTSEVEALYDELTQDMYQEIQEENYKALYGENVNFTIESFENVTMDGFPGYLIKTSFTPEGAQTIHQTIYIVLSSNRVFTLVYSWANDDYFDEAFAESMATIHVR